MSRLFQEDRLVLATHNQGKLEEIAALLTPFDVNVVGAGSLNLPEPEETESSFVGNARIKAHAAAKATGSPALADDSGIEIAALNGAPGVYTADWAETPKGRNFKMAMEKVHFELEKINGNMRRNWNIVSCFIPLSRYTTSSWCSCSKACDIISTDFMR